MKRDLRVPAIILRPKSPRLETIFWRAKIGALEGYFGFLAKNDANCAQIMDNIVWIVIYACPRSFCARSLRLETIFWQAQIDTLNGHFGILEKIDANLAQIMANIVWIVIYAWPRSFWAQNRHNWRQFFDGLKLAPWRAILGFWPKSMKIMPKSRIILYELWSTRACNHLEPKIARIGDNFLTGPNWHLGGPVWVFGQNRCKSCPNQG